MHIRQRASRPAALLTLCASLVFVVLPAVSRAQQNPIVAADIEQLPESSGRHAAISSGAVTTVPEDFAKLRLQPGYLVQLDVLDFPEITATYRVDENGDLTLPFLGAVHVLGDTITQGQGKIRYALYEREILKTPQVTLSVLQYAQQNVNVLGEVQTPGRIPLISGTSLANVLAMAGGETQAAGTDIEIRHRYGPATHIRYIQGQSTAPLQDVLIKPGESVFVSRAGVIYVLGAVTRPGGYLMVNGGTLNLLQAVSLAFGATNLASTGTIQIHRPKPNGDYTDIPVAYHAMEHGKAQPFPLQSGDIIFVPTSATKSLLLSSSALISTAVSSTIYRVP